MKLSQLGDNGDKIIMIKSVFGDLVLNIISVYAPQVGLSDYVKR
jgi:hypothetical protein